MLARTILPCIALALAPAAARAQDGAPAKVQQAASLTDFEQIVASLGHTVEAKDATSRSLRAVDGEGTRYVLTGTACDLDGIPDCRGIAMQALFEGGPSFEQLAEANLNQVAVSTRYDPQSRVVSITRYVVLDGGTTMSNITENLKVLLALAPEVLSILFGEEGGTPRPD